MAHLSMLREFRARLFYLRDALPLDCLLCRSRTAGGLCLHCSRAVTASMASEHRCPRCALALPPPVCKASLPDGIVAEVLRSTAARLGVAPRPEWGGGLKPLRSGCEGADGGEAGSVGSDPIASKNGFGRLPCPDCRGLSPALEGVTAAFDYAWPGDLLIQRLKLQGRFSCAPVLAGLLAARCHALKVQSPETSLCCERDTLVTAVPADSRSLALRGYNPAGEVGRALARRLGLEWQPELIRRQPGGRAQKDLGRQARRLWVQGLYRCTGAAAGREVLIVDDVMTTGATLSTIAEALKQQGATKAWGVVLARTPDSTRLT